MQNQALCVNITVEFCSFNRSYVFFILCYVMWSTEFVCRITLGI